MRTGYLQQANIFTSATPNPGERLKTFQIPSEHFYHRIHCWFGRNAYTGAEEYMILTYMRFLKGGSVVNQVPLDFVRHSQAGFYVLNAPSLSGGFMSSADAIVLSPGQVGAYPNMWLTPTTWTADCDQITIDVYKTIGVPSGITGLVSVFSSALEI